MSGGGKARHFLSWGADDRRGLKHSKRLGKGPNTHDTTYSTAQHRQHSTAQTDRQTVKSNESMELLVVDHCDDQQ